jgi:hypothetical protein
VSVDPAVLSGTRRGLAGVVTGHGGRLTTVADTTTGRFTAFGNAATNASGTVTFLAVLPRSNPAGEGIFAGPAGRKKIADGRELHATAPLSFGDPVINDAGTVADEVFPDSGGPEIVTGNGGPIAVRADPSVFSFSEHPSINNRNVDAFSATKFDGRQGIYAEPSGRKSTISVIQVGDQLFGSTVTSVDLGRFALNDNVQLAFHYVLADGRSGVAIAA